MTTQELKQLEKIDQIRSNLERAIFNEQFSDMTCEITGVKLDISIADIYESVVSFLNEVEDFWIGEINYDQFHLYKEVWSSVYEPAEGGYNVPVSSVALVYHSSDLEDIKRYIVEHTVGPIKWTGGDIYKVDTGEVDEDGLPVYTYNQSVLTAELENGEGFIVIGNEDPEPAETRYFGYR